jgi:hypothetical protein
MKHDLKWTKIIRHYLNFLCSEFLALIIKYSMNSPCQAPAFHALRCNINYK